MKQAIKFLLINLSILILLFTGCATVTDTLYLRQAEVTGPIYTPPIHLVDSVVTPALVVSPKFSLNTKKSFTGEVEQRCWIFCPRYQFCSSRT